MRLVLEWGLGALSAVNGGDLQEEPRMNTGKEEPAIVVEPAEEPVRQPERQPAPVETPAKDPVPA